MDDCNFILGVIFFFLLFSFFLLSILRARSQPDLFILAHSSCQPMRQGTAGSYPSSFARRNQTRRDLCNREDQRSPPPPTHRFVIITVTIWIHFTHGWDFGRNTNKKSNNVNTSLRSSNFPANGFHQYKNNLFKRNGKTVILAQVKKWNVYLAAGIFCSFFSHRLKHGSTPLGVWESFRFWRVVFTR